MLKTRIIGVLVVKNGWVVQSIGFRKYLPVGSLDVSVEYLNNWGIDEIIILDIDASPLQNDPDYNAISQASKYSYTPLSVGGGIRTLNHIENLIRSGADKVIINTAFLDNPSILKQGAEIFGSQCMIASIDIIQNDSKYSIYSRQSKSDGEDIVDTLTRAQEYGAGEIFINSVNRDGMKTGYDLTLYEKISSIVDIPIIFCGGVASSHHLVDGIKAGMDAVAAGNFFHYSEMSVVTSKQLLLRNELNVRLDTRAKFNDADFCKRTGRPNVLDEEVLEGMRFDYIPDEVI